MVSTVLRESLFFGVGWRRVGGRGGEGIGAGFRGDGFWEDKEREREEEQKRR